MTPKKIRAEIVLERIGWIRKMLEALRRLPASDITEFTSDERTAAAAESYLRRSLEALLDLGRHILAKGFGEGVVEYRAIATSLVERGIVGEEHRQLLTSMAGYRNRLTHFYSEVTVEELHDIVANRLPDIDAAVEAVLDWLRANPDLLDRSL